jgi:hypothetical protein
MLGYGDQTSIDLPGRSARAGWGGCIEKPNVSDTTFILISIAFFAICAAYAYFCEKVR